MALKTLTITSGLPTIRTPAAEVFIRKLASYVIWYTVRLCAKCAGINNLAPLDHPSLDVEAERVLPLRC